jgi:hypothetical protein
LRAGRGNSDLRSLLRRCYCQSRPRRNICGRHTFYFFGFSGLRFLDRQFSLGRCLRAQFGLVPIFLGKVVVNLYLGGSVGIGSGVNFGINESQRHFRHPGRIAVAGAGEDYVFHARAAQRLGRLLAEHPGDRVGNVRFTASVRADDGGNAFAVEFQLRAITERLESQNVQLLEFEQGHSLNTLRPNV